MKRILLVLCASFFAFPLSAQETKQFKLYIFGSEYSGQTTVFQNDLEKTPALKARLSELDYQYVDIDAMGEKDPVRLYYQYLQWTGKKEAPLFLVTDAGGDVYYIQDKYTSSAELLSKLQEEKLALRELMVEQKDIKKVIKKINFAPGTPLLTRMGYTPWKIGAEPGVVFSNLAGSDNYTDYKTGYYFHVYAKHYFTKKLYDYSLQAGLAFNSLGGKHTQSGDNLRLNYLTLPVDFEKVLFQPKLIPGLCAGYLNLAVGVYGSYLVSDKTPAGVSSDFNQWDAGARAKLLYHSGSFYLSVNYMRGFVDVLPGPEKGYNNAFQVTMGLVFGE